MKKKGVAIFFLLALTVNGLAQTVWHKTTEELVVPVPPFRQSHASTLVELESGEILMAWFGGSHEGGKDVVIWSSLLTRGKWSNPVVVADGIVNSSERYPTWNPVLFKEKKGKLFLFYKVGPNPRDWWGMVKSSGDNGKTWSVATRLPKGILGPIKNKPLQLEDGSILSPSSTETDRAWRAHIERSTDGGLTWNYIPIDTAGNVDVIQPSIIQFADGRLQVLCRSKQGYVMQASSTDNGKSWGPLSPTSLINPNSGTDAVTLQNGSQLIVYNPDVPGRDWWNGRSKLRVAVSQDGANWTDIAILEDGTKEEFSYPSVIQGRDGRVHISYTFDRKNIKYVVLEEKKIHSIIPYPSSVTSAEGGELVLSARSTVSAAPEFENAVTAFQQLAQLTLGNALPNVAKNAQVEFKKNHTITSDEGYRIEISSSKLIVSAKNPAGIFRAIQTLRQLTNAEVKSKTGKAKQLQFPVLTINDEPAFAWRGLHIDVARHFFSIEYLKKLLDRMAFYKLNKLHLHLTDDQGWRIEIKKYPLLTDLGAWRQFDKNDSACMRLAKSNPDMEIEKKHIIQRNGKTMYGGFYTQAEIRDLIKYAAERYIDIVPEIDMPGHMMAAIHAYPDLSCEGGSNWGELFSTPICPCKESTFEFSQNVFSEIIELFPSEYIHLGADEVDRKPWMKSELCQELMKKEGLKDAAELQSYFVKRMEKFFQSKGRKIIGWDEILEGGISSTAQVMYWRSWVPDAPVQAARNGNKVIMTPGNPLYFDNQPDSKSLSNIYHFNVIPKGLSVDEGKYILGAQANLWSEHVPSESRADYLYFPRALALAERVWSTSLNFSSFSQRLVAHYDRLETFGVKYRLPDVEGLTQENVFTDVAILDVRKPLPNLVLRYTTDGTLPISNSAEITKPIEIKEPVSIKLAVFNSTGLRGDIYTLNYKKESYLEPLSVTGTKQGLTTSYFKNFFRSTSRMANAKLDSQFVSRNVVGPSFKTTSSFALKFDGFIEIPQTGVYSFYLLCDDGGVLTIGDRVVVDNDGLHAPQEKSGQIALKQGLHRFRVDFIEGGGGYTLELKFAKGNGIPMNIPSSLLKHSTN